MASCRRRGQREEPAGAAPVTTITDAEGNYRLQNVLPGEYVLSAELEGFSRIQQTGIVINAGLNITIDITLKVGTLGETVNVVAETPMLESERSSKSVNISGEMQRRIPLTTRRDFSDFLEITPGVTARGFDQASGGQVYMLRGSDIENHVTQVDGADMGSFRQNWAGLYMGLSIDAVQDVQVKTAGADASSPLGVGVITQVSTPVGHQQAERCGRLRVHTEELERQQRRAWRELGDRPKCSSRICRSADRSSATRRGSSAPSATCAATSASRATPRSSRR